MEHKKQEIQYRVKERISFRETFCYGLGDFACNLIYGMVSSFATYYYTNSVGMAAMAIGTMFMISRIFDGVSDIVMGIIIDHTKSKYGKARPWVLWMAVPFAVAVILQFAVPQSFSTVGKLIYAYITYNFLSTIVYTAANQALGTMNVMITDNPQDRAHLSISRMAMAMIAAILLSCTVMPLVAAFGGDSKAWTITAAIMGTISVILFLIVFANTKERIGGTEEETNTKKAKVPIGVSLKALFTNKYWLNRIGFTFAITVAAMTSSSNVYYAQYWLGNENLVGMLTAANTLPMVLSLSLVNFLMKRIGTRNTSLLGTAIMVVGCVLQVAAPTNCMIVLIGYGIRGFGTGLATTVTSVMLGDTIDYGEWKSGVRTDGLVFSASSFGTKVGTGLATASLGWALAWGGFDSTLAVQSASAMTAIKAVFAFVPMAASLLAMILNIFFNLEKKMPQIMADLRARETVKEKK